MFRSMPLLAASFFALAVFASDDFEFRSDDRPEYGKVVGVGALRSDQEENAVTLLDVRLVEDFNADPVLIPGAVYRDPDGIADWAGELSSDSKVIVYCVRGKWVSHKAADYLSRQGLDVHVLEGGLEAWKLATE